MTAPLTYEIRLDPDETIRALRDVRRRQRFVWLRSPIREWALWPVIVGMAILYFFLPGYVRGRWLVGLAAFLLAALVGPATHWVVRRQLRRAYRETPGLRGVQVYQFSDAGLTITGGATTVTLGWDSLVEAAETTAPSVARIHTQQTGRPRRRPARGWRSSGAHVTSMCSRSCGEVHDARSSSSFAPGWLPHRVSAGTAI